MGIQLVNKFGFLNIDTSNGNVHAKLTGTFNDYEGNSKRVYNSKEIKNRVLKQSSLQLKKQSIKKMVFYFLALSNLSETSCQFITFHQAET